MSDKPQDSSSTLRAFVEEVELRHVEGPWEECMFCSDCGDAKHFEPWPCDAARGAAAIRAMLDWATPEDSTVPRNRIQRARRVGIETLLRIGAAALGGKP